MIVDKINSGIVIDHIKAGKSMEIYNFLRLDKADCVVAVIQNAIGKHGKKDLIKIENPYNIDVNILGYIDPNITINYIENGEVSEKKHLKLPEKLDNIVQCKNPRCVTSIEQEIKHQFKLVDAKTATYRCIYCEEKLKNK